MLHAVSCGGCCNMANSWDHMWTPIEVEGNGWQGWVPSLSEVAPVVKSFEISSSVTYVKDFEEVYHDPIKNKQKRVRFKDIRDSVIPEDGVPFMTMSHSRHACMFGPDRNAAKKKSDKEEREKLLAGDHPTKKRYKKVKGSIKKGCQAVIHVKEVTRFIDYKVINAYFHLLMRDTNTSESGHVFVVPSFVAVQWIVPTMEPWMFQKVTLSKYSWLFMPINVRNNHWILLAANVPGRKVSILDSLSGSDDAFYIGKFRQYMAERAETTGELHGEWSHDKTITSAQQKDGNSCGPFVMLNALALSRNIEPVTLEQAHAQRMRNYVLSKLRSAAVKPPKQRKVCDMVGCTQPKLPTDWVCCGVCGRWCHYKCVQICKPPDGDYVCSICKSQYE